MTAFKPGEPVITKEPVVVVDAGLKPGVHHIQLVVVDQAGNESQPDTLTVQVIRLAIPGPP